jgi:DNA polymerase-3 subunit delta
VPARPVAPEDLPDPLPFVVLLVGDEELLIDRAIIAVAARARATDPAVEETELVGSALEGPELNETLSPSLFGDAKLVVLRAAQDVKVAVAPSLMAVLKEPLDATVVVIHHAGGAKGKAVLDGVRKLKPLEISCAKPRPDDRAEFVRWEVRRAGGRIGPDAVSALIDSVGSDLRELSGVCAQLVSDSLGTAGTASGEVTLDLVRAHHRGKAEVSGFAVSDLAMVGRGGPALEALRTALGLGVPQVVIADALADGVRSVARVAGAGRGSDYDLAKRLGMPPWKVKRAASQARGWSEAGLLRAMGIVATLNADVKGEAVDADYALERAIRRLAAARSMGRS